jgi:hypothetical protein
MNAATYAPVRPQAAKVSRVAIARASRGDRRKVEVSAGKPESAIAGPISVSGAKID